MSGWSDEVDPNEVLVGAEAYQRMLDDCDDRLKLAGSRIDGYEGTRQTLKALLQSCKQDLLIPVAGGLGYFDGTISHTNKVLVLLGENIFAERSVADAVGVADRRIGYLTAERQALEIERADIVDKQKLFIECGVQGSSADSKVGPRKQTVAKESPIVSKMSQPTPAPASVNHTTKDDENEDQVDPADLDDQDHGENYEEEDEEGAEGIIDPRDELTIDELVELEEELGDDIADEEKAEAAIMALVNKKKNVRLAREAAIFYQTQEGTGANTTSASPQAAPSSSLKTSEASQNKSVHFDPKTNTSTASSSTMTISKSQPSAASMAFASPADIGKMFSNAGGAFGNTEDSQPTTTSEGTASETDPTASKPVTAAVAPTRALKTEAVPEPAIPALATKSFTSGPMQDGVVEKNIPNAFGGPASTGATNGVAMKREKRSLFGKEMGLK